MLQLPRSLIISIATVLLTNTMAALGRNAAIVSRTPWPRHSAFLPSSRTRRPNILYDTTQSTSYHTTNQQLVARRNEINTAKRLSRQKALDKDRERNYKLRTLFSAENTNSSNDGFGVPPMFAVKVVTDHTLRTELKMNGREKRGRMFVERPPNDDTTNDEYASTSLKALKQTIHEFFRRLKKSTYLLSAGLPVLDEEGNVLMYDDDDERDVTGTWELNDDNDVQNAFREAENFFLEQHQRNNTTMKRPTLILYITKDPNAPLPPPPPLYLQNMSDPTKTPTMTMLSFYSFPPNGIEDPESTADQLKRLWRPFHALGRIYVAHEGVNAQMSVPTNVLPNFLQCCTHGELSTFLGRYMENGINIDPIPVPREEFDKDPPFKNLHIRVRAQIVADGLEEALDWGVAGYDMPPLEWHERLKGAREKLERGDGDEALPIVFDCRNDYETQVGKFELAEPLQTENFRDSWDVLKERLKDTPRDTPIMTYCTGGIRCVKVNAYLIQKLEFTNVSRLAGGIIGYDRTLNEKAPTEEPMFKGTNYVFDGRMGRRITNDQLGTCTTCGGKTHLVSNCKNESCHKRMVQCEYCRDSFFGTCSEGCKMRVVNTGMPPVGSTSVKGAEEKDDKLYNNLDDYSAGYSSSTPLLLNEIEHNTKAFMPTGAHMVSGAMQGVFLKMLASMTREGRVLEIGTFTGYATACFLEGVAIAGRGYECEDVGSRSGGGPYVLSMERDRRALGVAAAHLRVMCDHGIGGEAAEQAANIRKIDGGVEDFDGESITFLYNNIASCELRRVNDALAAIEEMASGSTSEPTKPFDIVFVDADKTRLMEYVDVLVSTDAILKKGGLIVVDNVLWKGLVLDACASDHDIDSHEDSDSSDSIDQDSLKSEKELLRRNRRARKLANKMHRFNSAVVQDDRVEVLLMPLRDGLSLIRKK